MPEIYSNELIKIEREPSEIPWLKIFSQQPYKEFSDAPMEVRMEILRVMDIIEREMIRFFNPTKINLASFGNHLPHLHWHVMARFEQDSYYPEPMWGSKQREGSYGLEDFDTFVEGLKKIL